MQELLRVHHTAPEQQMSAKYALQYEQLFTSNMSNFSSVLTFPRLVIID